MRLIRLKRPWFRAVRLSSNLATLAACRLVRWTGKHTEAIHPKHLISHPAVAWHARHVKRGDRILDVGTGTGAQAVPCARAGAWVVGIEFNPANLSKARTLTADMRIRLVRCDATKTLPFRSGSFTAILALDVLEHFTDPLLVLKECAHTLRPGGWVAISLPNADTKWKRRYREAGLPWMSDRDHKHEYSWPEVERLIEAAGLRLQSGPEPIVIDTPLTGLFDLVGGISLRLYSRLVDRRVRRAARNPRESVGFRCIAIKP